MGMATAMEEAQAQKVVVSDQVRRMVESIDERATTKLELCRIPANDSGVRLHSAMVSLCRLYDLDPLQHVDAWEQGSKLYVRVNVQGMRYIAERSGRVKDLAIAVYPPGCAVVRDSKGQPLAAPNGEPLVFPEKEGMVGEFRAEVRSKSDPESVRTVWGQYTQREWQTSDKGGSAWGTRPRHMLTIRTEYRFYADVIGVEEPEGIGLTIGEKSELQAAIGERMAAPKPPKPPTRDELITQIEQVCDVEGLNVAEVVGGDPYEAPMEHLVGLVERMAR